LLVALNLASGENYAAALDRDETAEYQRRRFRQYSRFNPP
jgi:hypothetical protein